MQDKLAVLVLLLFSMLISSCSYSDKVAPVTLPDASPSMVVVGSGTKIAASAFLDKGEAEKAFGFDARKAGLLPVQVTFQNDGVEPVRIEPEQTFIVDNINNAWPILTKEQTYERTKKYVEVGETAGGALKPALLGGAAGAIAGLAVGIISGHNVGEAIGKGAALGAAGGAIIGGADAYANVGDKIKEDLHAKTLKNTSVLPNQIAYGVLFFPGSDSEAKSVYELRLALTVGNERQVVRLRPVVR